MPAPMTLQTWTLALGAGVLCGFLNAAASSGSALTLPLLLSLGLPPAVANGTNRVCVLAGMVTASWRFQRAGVIPWRLLSNTRVAQKYTSTLLRPEDLSQFSMSR